MGSWALVTPVKTLDRAKSRLAAVAGERRADLALAMAADTVEAALRSPAVAALVVVTDDPEATAELKPLGAVIVRDEPDSGLNPALLHGARTARAYASSVGALSADLPALRPDLLAAVLEHAQQHPSAFLADLAGTGTTLYTAAVDAAFSPSFGEGSAQRHRAAGAAELDGEGLDPLRRDVDTRADLVAAVRLGTGPRTAALARDLLET
ncbi:MAG: 2-phospho-L-lactate guanylyltransferase [Streptosporangiales bacterium]